MLDTDVNDGMRGSAPVAPPTTRHGETRRIMTILDGRGGTLALDFAGLDPRLLTDACQRLLSGDVPRGASVIKVCSGDRCYLLSRQSSQHGEDLLSIANLFDPGERVALGCDLAWMVIGLLESVHRL